MNVTPRQYLFQYLQQRIAISARFYVFRVRNSFTNAINLVSLATLGVLLIKEYLHLRPFLQILSVCKAIYSTASVLVWQRHWSKNTVLCGENESVLFGWPWKQLWSFIFSWSSTVSFCRFNTRSSHRSSCSQLYRLSVYLLFERVSYFGRENETTSSNSLQRLVGIFSPYWSIDWVGCSVPPWSYDNFLPAKNKFPRILRNKFGF